MTEHTKGPWSISHVEMFGRGGKGTKHYIFEGGDYVVKPSPGQAGPVVIAAGEANAARIVACVNALEGYNPAAVRDVVEALREIACFGDTGANAHLAATGSYGEFDEPAAVATARKALAALEGGVA